MDDPLGPPLAQMPTKDDSDVRQKVLRRRKIFAAVLVVTILAVGCVLILFQTESRYSSSSSSQATVVRHSAYEKISRTEISEVQADLVVYKHKKTQTQLITLIPKDKSQDSTFGVSFRTLPNSSTGAAHVLEHSVLSGSEKYPSKDPFNALRRGSLKTFLNAFTYPDRTVYVIASRNFVDFRNLMSVYLDAVFRPRAMTPEGAWILRQEGWRIDETDDGELEFNGVVLSEMKGAYSDPEELLAQYTQAALFPDTPYRLDSGGKPSEIPSLTRGDFEAFYAKFYHPTNAQLFVFGSTRDVRECMDQANEYLQEHDARPDIRESSAVPWQEKKFKTPKTVQKQYPSSNGENGDYKLKITWLVNDSEMNLMMEMAWNILDYLLLSSPTSALQKPLIESTLGDYVIDDGFDSTLQQATFAVGLEGLESEEDMSTVERIIMKTLQEVVDNGFRPQDITSAMNRMEFDIRELDGEGNPRGVNLLLGGLSKWNYDFDPKASLQYDDAFKELKDIVSESGSKFFEQLVSGLLQNNHRVVLQLTPSTDLTQEMESEEADRLEALRDSDQQFEQLIVEYKDMKLVQATDDPPAVLAAIPTLSVEDLNPSGEELPITVATDVKGSGVTVLKHEVASSFGIAYIDFGLEISELDFDDIHLLPLLSQLMLEAGKDVPNGDIHLDRQIGMHTGGIDVGAVILPVRPADLDDDNVYALDGSHMSTKLFFRGSCTTENAQKLLSLYREMLIDGTLDVKSKAISILKETLSDMEYAVGSDGDSVVNTRLKARYGILGLIDEKVGGVSTLKTLAEELHTAKTNWSSLLERLERMKATILAGHRNGMVLNLTGDKGVLSSIGSAVDIFLDKHLPPLTDSPEFVDFSEQEHPWVAKAQHRMLPIVNEAFVIPTQVSYVGQGGALYQPGEVIDGSAAVVSKYLSTGYLYRQLRLKGGAYGASSRLDVRAGLFSMTTYRDPNLVSTLEVFDGAALSLKGDAITGRSISTLPPEAADAIIGTIGSLDGSAPQNSAVGWTSLNQWLRGESAQLRQNWRNQVLSTSWADFEDFSARLASWEDVTIAIVTSPNEYKDAVSNGINLERHNPLQNSTSL